jgi:diguanylate cyclase (GGDEF)-like protein
MGIVVKSPTAGRARRRRWTGVAAVLAVLISGGLASSGAALAVQRAQQRLATQAMDTYQATISHAVQEKVTHYAYALADVAAAINTEPRLTADDFQGLTAQLTDTRLPGASGIGFAVPAFDQDAAATQALWRSRGATGLSLYRTGTADEHAFVIFTRTFNGTPVGPGRDLNRTGETADALRIARETGAFTLSRAHVLVRDRGLPPAQQQMSFTLAMPVFAPGGRAGIRKLRGWVTMGVRGGDFLARTLRSQAQGAVQVTLDDPYATSPKAIAEVAPGTLMTSPGLVRSETLDVGHHTWHLVLRPTTRLLSTSDRWASQLTLLAGIAVTVLLGVLVAVLAGARNKAMDRVDQATAALRKDIERREAVEAQLQILAFSDQLTGLANRGLFYDRVAHALHTHVRAGHTFAVFFIDLDGFKQVNDELGHSAGDIVLKAVAARLRDCLRDGDTVARFGGDEFAVIAERLATAENVHVTGDRIVCAVREPIDVGGGVFATVTASVGIALNRPGDTADDVLHEADLAMYTAKTTGKGRHVLAGAADDTSESKSEEQV